MEPSQHSMRHLFAQLGLPDDEQSIEQFIGSHRPLPEHMPLDQAPFWSPAQAAFLREEIAEDADWVPLIDDLNARLH